MPLLFIHGLSISYLVYHKNPLLAYLLLPGVILIGALLMVVSAIMILKSTSSKLNWHEFFAIGALLVWLPYWYPDFNNDAPMFVAFPAFLAIIANVISWIFVAQRQHFDPLTIDYMKKISGKSRLQPPLTIALVGVSLFLKEHYLLFPVAMTLFFLKYALVESLKDF